MATWSFVFTIGVLAIQPNLLLAVSTKLFLIYVLYLMLNDLKIRKKLGFYRISGVSDFKFFGVIFLIDSILTTFLIVLIKGFI